MRVAAVVLSGVGLVFALIGTAEFLPTARDAIAWARGKIRNANATLRAWLILRWAKTKGSKAGLALLGVVLAILVFAHLTSRQDAEPTTASASASDTVGVSDSVTWTMTSGALPEDEWRAGVNDAIRKLSEQQSRTQRDLLDAEARLRGETVDQVSALRKERHEADRKALAWIFAGVLYQLASAGLGLLGR